MILPADGGCIGAGLGTILVEREMRSGLGDDIENMRDRTRPQVALVEDDDVIQALAADRADDARLKLLGR